jgi:hypothetical protein
MNFKWYATKGFAECFVDTSHNFLAVTEGNRTEAIPPPILGTLYFPEETNTAAYN